MIHVGIYLFEDVEVLDFAGPFEVFSVASQLRNYQNFHVFTFSDKGEKIKAINGLSVNPDFSLTSAPKIDYLILPGGNGTNQVILQQDVMLLLAAKIDHSKWTMSVCSGSRILGILGLLDGKPYCTHHLVYESMAEIVKNGFPKKGERFIQADKKTYTSAGISAGIDLSLHLLEATFGKELAKETAEYMEYIPYLKNL